MTEYFVSNSKAYNTSEKHKFLEQALQATISDLIKNFGAETLPCISCDRILQAIEAQHLDETTLPIIRYKRC